MEILKTNVLLKCIFILIILIAPFNSAFAQTLAITYYVDTQSGNDVNNGLSLEKPFKTISKAKEAVRLLDKSGYNNITVNLRGGTYFQDKTLEFTEKDGGTATCKITYQNYKDEVPVISGGKLITGWKLFDKSSNIYRANIGNLTFRQLYINGNWGIRARTPDTTRNLDIEWDEKAGTIKIEKKNIAKWKNFQKVEMVTLNAWTGNHLRLESFTTDSLYAYITIQKEEQCVFRVPSFAFQGKEYFFENAYEFLDSEGEWYLNTSEKYLYYKPRADENMALAEVIAPQIVNIVKVEGATSDSVISYLHFKGISFMHSTWLRPDTFGNVEMQAAQYFMQNAFSGPGEFTGRPDGGVLIKNADHIAFNRCLFANMGATALDFVSGTHNVVVSGNIFRDIAGNGLAIGLTTKETESNMTIYNPSDPKEIPGYLLVSNNYITRIGKDNMGGVGIMYAYVRDTKIIHNEIENVPYSGISGGWGWDSTRTQMCNNTISNNYIHNYMNFYYDGAGIYTLSNQPNSVCKNNYVENLRIGARGYGCRDLFR